MERYKEDELQVNETNINIKYLASQNWQLVVDDAPRIESIYSSPNVSYQK